TRAVGLGVVDRDAVALAHLARADLLGGERLDRPAAQRTLEPARVEVLDRAHDPVLLLLGRAHVANTYTGPARRSEPLASHGLARLGGIHVNDVAPHLALAPRPHLMRALVEGHAAAIES